MIYADTNICLRLILNDNQEMADFVDCILLAYNQIDGSDVATFDKKLKNKLNS